MIGALGSVVFVTGAVLLSVMIVVARTVARDKRNNAASWARYQSQLPSQFPDFSQTGLGGPAQPVRPMVEPAPAQPALPGGSGQATVTVTGVTQLPIRPVQPAVQPALAATPIRPIQPDRPGVGDRVRAGGGKWGHVQAVSRPVAGITRYHLRMDDGATGYVDVPDQDAVPVRAMPFAAPGRDRQAGPLSSRDPFAPPQPQRRCLYCKGTSWTRSDPDFCHPDCAFQAAHIAQKGDPSPGRQTCRACGGPLDDGGRCTAGPACIASAQHPRWAERSRPPAVQQPGPGPVSRSGQAAGTVSVGGFTLPFAPALSGDRS